MQQAVQFEERRQMASNSDCSGMALLALDEKRSTANHRGAPRAGPCARIEVAKQIASVFPHLAGGERAGSR
jgi:hypothetical protein